jgi:hypothetical protein
MAPLGMQDIFRISRISIKVQSLLEKFVKGMLEYGPFCG